jgi:predicted phage-related endonuclease
VTPLRLGLTPEQIAERRNGIGGSDAGKILSGDWLPLWLEKTGRAEPEDLSTVLPVQIGLITEPLNLAWFARETGREVWGCGEAWKHNDFDFIRCTLDGVTWLEPGRLAVVQAKHVNPFAKIEEVEQRYMGQVHHEMLVTGARVAFLSVFLGTQKWECVEIERDDDYAARLLEYEVEFWGYVQRDEPPPQQEPVAAPVITKFRTADMSGSNSWAAHAGDWIANKGAAVKFKDAEKGLRSLVDPDVGLAIGHGVQAKRSKDGKLLLREIA